MFLLRVLSLWTSTLRCAGLWAAGYNPLSSLDGRVELRTLRPFVLSGPLGLRSQGRHSGHLLPLWRRRRSRSLKNSRNAVVSMTVALATFQYG